MTDAARSTKSGEVKSALEAFGQGLDECKERLIGESLTHEEAQRFTYAFCNFYLYVIAPRVKP